MTKATLIIQEGSSQKALDLPVLKGTLGADVINVSGLASEGVFTYDPGFMSTASCTSDITFIDGAKGVLLHRGYPVSELAKSKTFTEVCYLLFYGELPTTQELEWFESKLRELSDVPDFVKGIIKAFDRNAHPMSIMSAAVSALSLNFQGRNLSSASDREFAMFDLVAKIPTITALAYRHLNMKEDLKVHKDLDYPSRFVELMFSSQDWGRQLSTLETDAMNKIFILHADHEQNASTSTVRLTGSTGVNPYAAISAGISALWGPAHGGANEAVLKVLESIGTPDKVSDAIERAKDPNDPFRLMGFGHRVYRNFDPRAKIMKGVCDQILHDLKINDPLFEVAQALEKIALEDEYFISRKLYPNVDFYSGIVLRALHIPTEMFTPIFALSRTIGWLSHWNEFHAQGNNKIGRPRQLYTGLTQR